MLQWVAFSVASEGPVLGRGAANAGSRSYVAATGALKVRLNPSYVT